jgi:hypothetical protein
MSKSRKKRYRIIEQFTYKGELREPGKGIYLSNKESEILINKNLVRK